MNSHAHALVREGEKGEACLLTLLLLELNIRTQGCGITRDCGFMRSRGGLRSTAGKENGWLLFTHLKPKAEGMRQRFSQNYIQITKTACVNPKHIIYLSVRVIASDESRTRHGGIALLHRNHEVGEVSGRRVSKAGRKRLFPGSENLLMQITEKRQLPPLILEFTPLRNRSSSFEERESRGSSSNPCVSFSAARESTSTSSE